MRWFIRRAKRRWERTDYEWRYAFLKGELEYQFEEIGEALMPPFRKAVDVLNEIGRVFARVGGPTPAVVEDDTLCCHVGEQDHGHSHRCCDHEYAKP